MAQESGITVTIDGTQHKLDDFELGDLEWLEEYMDTTLDDAKALSSMKAAVGFVFLIKRRENPDFTIEDARKTKLSVFSEIDEPTANGNGAKTPARKRRPTTAAK